MNVVITPATAATTSASFTVYGMTKISCDEAIAVGEMVFLLEGRPNGGFEKAKDTDGSVICLTYGRTTFPFMACGTYSLHKSVTAGLIGAGYDNEG